MDLNALVASQSRPENQCRFDPEAFDRAVMRAERRREARQALWVKFARFEAWITARWATRKRVSSAARSGTAVEVGPAWDRR